ncbi:helix-turn-helix domain-containing protein [Actinomyces bowdenii]|uniref:sugar-binding transcriptional regulator n=1 Tax=Actinomyces bowdenii TaxID=131109 RepID=UPI001ABC89C3|nr:sugar-binding domain-containing protein [Actinomyces bowdenii]MBO3723721.1 helix-turn-helix domain-containing protein [Actinomyces bowdenii]
MTAEPAGRGRGRAPRSRPRRTVVPAAPEGPAASSAPPASAPPALTDDPSGLLRAYEAASMYYIQGETMEVIARHLGVSRSTVSRLLLRAKQVGIVRIELIQPGGAGSLEGRLLSQFGVRAQIVPVREGATEILRLQQVAGVAAGRMVDLIGELTAGPRSAGAEPGADPAGGGAGGAGSPGPGRAEPAVQEAARGLVVGVAWGTTMSEVSAALPSRTVPGLTVVQLNGATDPMEEGTSAGEMLSRIAGALRARSVAFPVPAFFDHVETREAMWSERSVRRVLALVGRARLAVFGVGSLEGSLPSQVYEGGHLSSADRAVVRREKVVGDVCTVMLRADGSWRDIDLNARATGPTPAQLSRIPRRLCVVAGVAKAPALLAALRARVATDLVVDDATARAVLDLAARTEHRP